MYICLYVIQGAFLPVFKKLRAALKKIKPIFGKKTLKVMEATEDIKKKTRFFVDKNTLWLA